LCDYTPGKQGLGLPGAAAVETRCRDSARARPGGSCGVPLARLLRVIGTPITGEWLKLTAIAVFVFGLCVAAYLANRP
jgi:hypothetical protein